MEVECHTNHRDLGIIVSYDLSWSNHYKYILAKAYYKLSMIRRTFSCLCPGDTRKKLYISLIRSQLLHGSQLWRPTLIKDIRKLNNFRDEPPGLYWVEPSPDYLYSQHYLSSMTSYFSSTMSSLLLTPSTSSNLWYEHELMFDKTCPQQDENRPEILLVSSTGKTMECSTHNRLLSFNSYP